MLLSALRYVPLNFPYIFSKETYILSKQPRMPVQEPCTISHCTHAPASWCAPPERPSNRSTYPSPLEKSPTPLKGTQYTLKRALYSLKRALYHTHAPASWCAPPERPNDRSTYSFPLCNWRLAHFIAIVRVCLRVCARVCARAQNWSPPYREICIWSQHTHTHL